MMVPVPDNSDGAMNSRGGESSRSFWVDSLAFIVPSLPGKFTHGSACKLTFPDNRSLPRVPSWCRRSKRVIRNYVVNVFYSVYLCKSMELKIIIM
jgi:hypothetical protein